MSFRYSCILMPACIALISFSCSKDKSGRDILLGKWKSSYGDTISFYKENGKNIVHYKVASYSPGPVPVGDFHEYSYENERLSIKDNAGSSEPFRELTTFTWTDKGNVFTVQGVQWFMFMSATITYFKFTKIK